MDDSLRISQFCIQAGNWQQRPASVAIVDGHAAGPLARKFKRQRGNLYVLLEAVHAVSVPDETCEQLLAAIVDAYYAESGSITRGLRASLLAGNTWLFEQNVRADSAHRLLMGLNCVVIREGDMYVGQVGPALVTLHQGDALQRFPAESIWLRSDSPSSFDLNREPPAGMRRELEPAFYHASLGAGDVLVMSTTSLVRLANAGELAEAFASHGGEAVRGNLEVLANGRDLTTVVLECPGQRSRSDYAAARPPAMAEPPLVAREVAPPAAASAAGKAASGISAVPSAPAGVPPAPTQGKRGRDDGQAAAVAATQPPHGDQAIVEGEALEEQPLEEEPLEVPLAERWRTPRGRRDQRATPGGERTPEEPSGWRRRVDEGAKSARASAEEFLDKVLPDRVPERPAQRAPAEPGLSVSGWALVLVALAIPLVMLVLIILMRVQYDRAQQGQFSTQRILAHTRYDQAMATQDRVLMRRGLIEASKAAEDGLAMRAQDEDLNDLQRRISLRLDDVDKVERLFHFWQVAVVDDDPTSATDSSRIVVEGVDLFLLNRGSDRVYRWLLSDAGDALQPPDKGPLLVQKGQLLGGIKVGDLVDIAWLESGGQRSLSTFVVLERNGSLLAYEKQQGIDVLPVADSHSWQKPQAIGSFYGNLYVLDALQSRILKYTPVDNAYTAAPSDYIAFQLNIDLSGAVDMTIDGNLYVLLANGTILRLNRGELQSFTMAGLPSPMRSPTSIFVSGPKKAEGDGYVYVTDTGNERVLQFDKAGNYMRQFRAKQGDPQMRGLRGIYVDEARHRMFLLAGRTLWVSNIPTTTK